MRKSLGGKKSKHFPHFFAAKESSNYAMIIAVVSNSNEHDFVLSAHKVETDDGTKLFFRTRKKNSFVNLNSVNAIRSTFYSAAFCCWYLIQ